MARNFKGLAVWPDAQNGLYFATVTMPEGEVLDILVQSKRDERAALKLMRKLLQGTSNNNIFVG